MSKEGLKALGLFWIRFISMGILILGHTCISALIIVNTHVIVGLLYFCSPIFVIVNYCIYQHNK